MESDRDLLRSRLTSLSIFWDACFSCYMGWRMIKKPQLQTLMLICDRMLGPFLIGSFPGCLESLYLYAYEIAQTSDVFEKTIEIFENFYGWTYVVFGVRDRSLVIPRVV